jgi:hypothetical protein
MPRRRTVDQIGDLARRLYEERLRGTRPGRMEEDPEDPRPPSGRIIDLGPEPILPSRRKIAMPRRSVRGAARRSNSGGGGYGDPVYTWAFRSSQARGGDIITYETRLEEDGTVRCNCPGWRFVKKDKNTGEPKPRECKHTNTVEGEAPDILRRFRRGEQLPVFETQQRPTPTLAQQTPAVPAAARDNTTNIRRGRVIDLDD